MQFGEVIENIMPDVNSGADDTVLLWRIDGEWNYEYQKSVSFKDGINNILKKDPCTLMITGKDFAKGSYPYVYDKVLAMRFRLEYDLLLNRSDVNQEKADELIDFFEEHMSAVSGKAAFHLTKLDRPFTEIYKRFLNSESGNDFIESIDEHIESIVINEKTNNFDLRAVPNEESVLFFRKESEDAERGCIGYLRADFGRNGKEFWPQFFDVCTEYKTQEFRDELDVVINKLRDDGMLKNRPTMAKYCAAHPEAKLADTLNKDSCGFKIETEHHSYYLRAKPELGHYDLYAFCYDRATLENYLDMDQQEEQNNDIMMGGM